MSSLTPSAVLAILQEGLKLSGKDSPATQLIGEKLGAFLGAREKAALDKAMASARGEREQTHKDVQDALKPRG